jgi:hypothetical protein
MTSQLKAIRWHIFQGRESYYLFYAVFRVAEKPSNIGQYARVWLTEPAENE